MPAFMQTAAGFDVPVEGLRWVADLAESYDCETDLGVAAPMGIPSRRTVRREPVGVVAAITPWNVPTQINLAKVGPALAAGCTVVLKPAPDTPVAGLRARPAGRRAHRPAAGRAQRRDAALRRGRRACWPPTRGSTWCRSPARPRPGGRSWPPRRRPSSGSSSNSAASPPRSCSTTPTSPRWRGHGVHRCIHAGQGCAITTRLVVPRERYDEAVRVAAATMESIGAKDPADPGAICGPVISEAQRDRVESYLGWPSRRAAPSPPAATSSTRTASGSSRRSSPASTTPRGWRRRRSSGRCSSSSRTTATTTRCGSPTSRRTASRARSTPPTWSAPRPSPGGSGPARSPSTAGCGSARTRRSAATSSPGRPRDGRGRLRGVPGDQDDGGARMKVTSSSPGLRGFETVAERPPQPTGARVRWLRQAR